MFDDWIPPTAPIDLVVTSALPLATGELVADELLNTGQLGMYTVALPEKLIDGAAVGSSASMHGSPIATPDAVADAVIVGAVLTKTELNGSDCCTASPTVTWSVMTPEFAG